MNQSASQYFIKTLELQAHPEGGYFREVYRANESIIRDNQDKRDASTSIYYLLEGEDFAAWHLLYSDQVYIHNIGSPLLIHMINKNTGELDKLALGNPLENERCIFQFTIPALTWFAVEVMDKASYALATCVVSPGFEFHDFELAKRDDLIKRYPEHKGIIEQFTRL